MCNLSLACAKMREVFRLLLPEVRQKEGRRTISAVATVADLRRAAARPTGGELVNRRLWALLGCFVCGSSVGSETQVRRASELRGTWPQRRGQASLARVDKWLGQFTAGCTRMMGHALNPYQEALWRSRPPRTVWLLLQP